MLISNANGTYVLFRSVDLAVDLAVAAVEAAEAATADPFSNQATPSWS